MSRNIYYPDVFGSASKGVRPIATGGTGASTPAAARAALGIVGLDQLGVNGGLAKLDSTGNVPAVIVPRYPMIQGVTRKAIAGSTINATITDYDSYTTYTCTVSGGTVSRSGDQITWVLPSSAGEHALTVNGRSHAVSVTSNYVNTPSITSPVAGSAGLTETITLTSSAFSMAGISDLHLKSDWELATDAGFMNVIRVSYGSTANLTSWTVSGLLPNTAYYARVRYYGKVTVLVSQYCTGSAFTTKATFVASAELGRVALLPTGADFYLGDAGAISEDGRRVVLNAHYTNRLKVYAETNSVWSQEDVINPIAPGYGSLTTDGQAAEVCTDQLWLSRDGSMIITRVAGTKTADGDRDVGLVVYKRTGTSWAQSQLLTSNALGLDTAIGSDGTLGRYFCVSGDGKVLFAQASIMVEGVNRFGLAVFTYNGTQWVYQTHAAMHTLDVACEFDFGRMVCSYDGGVILSVSATYTHKALVLQYLSGKLVPLAVSSFTNASTAVAPTSLALSGDGMRVVMGYADYPGSATYPGRVYIYTRTGALLTVEGTIDPNFSTKTYLGFGQSVAISHAGNYVMVGNIGSNATHGGTRLTRTGTTWSITALFTDTLSASPLTDHFGKVVLMTPNAARVAVVGSGNGQMDSGAKTMVIYA